MHSHVNPGIIESWGSPHSAEAGSGDPVTRQRAPHVSRSAALPAASATGLPADPKGLLGVSAVKAGRDGRCQLLFGCVCHAGTPPKHPGKETAWGLTCCLCLVQPVVDVARLPCLLQMWEDAPFHNTESFPLMQVMLCWSFTFAVVLKRLGEVSADHTSPPIWGLVSSNVIFMCLHLCFSSHVLLQHRLHYLSILSVHPTCLGFQGPCCHHDQKMLKRWNSWGQLTLWRSCFGLPAGPDQTLGGQISQLSTYYTKSQDQQQHLNLCFGKEASSSYPLDHTILLADTLRSGWYQPHSSQVTSRKRQHKPNKQPRKK